jgi:hypothetical protein
VPDKTFPSVILSGVGAHATTQSKDLEDVDNNDAASGNSLEIKKVTLSRIPVSERAQSSARE